MRNEMTEKYIVKADILFNRGLYKDAVENCENALEIGIEDPRLSMWLGKSLHLLERYGEALEHFEKAEYLGCEDGNMYLYMGECNFNTGRYEEAVYCYQQAEDFGLIDATLFTDMGVSLYLLERYEDALEYLRKAELIIDGLGKIQGRLYMALGKCLYSLEQYKDAIEYISLAKNNGYDEENLDKLIEEWKPLAKEKHFIRKNKVNVPRYYKEKIRKPKSNVMLWVPALIATVAIIIGVLLILR